MAVTWPITKTGTYASGSVASASDFSSDFTTLYDAVNQVHNRFSTQHIRASYTAYMDAAPLFTSFSVGTKRSLFHLFRVPDWMQGLRVRRFSVGNMSNPTVTTWSNHSSESLKFKLATASAIGAFDVDDWDATDMVTTDFSISASQDAFSGIHSSAGYPTVIEADITSNNVLVPGDYLAAYFIGGTDWAGTLTFDIRFDINILCDAMVPVP